MQSNKNEQPSKHSSKKTSKAISFCVNIGNSNHGFTSAWEEVLFLVSNLLAGVVIPILLYKVFFRKNNKIAFIVSIVLGLCLGLYSYLSQKIKQKDNNSNNVNNVS